MSKMCKDSVEEREGEILTPEAYNQIKKFDAALSDKRESDSSKAQGQGFCGGICLAIVVLTVRGYLNSLLPNLKKRRKGSSNSH